MKTTQNGLNCLHISANCKLTWSLNSVALKRQLYNPQSVFLYCVLCTCIHMCNAYTLWNFSWINHFKLISRYSASYRLPQKYSARNMNEYATANNWKTTQIVSFQHDLYNLRFASIQEPLCILVLCRWVVHFWAPYFNRLIDRLWNSTKRLNGIEVNSKITRKST